MKTTFKFLSVCFLFSLVGCGTQSFNKKIDSDENDAIHDESFMRYNSARINSFEKKSKSNIAKAQAACHEEKFYKGKSILENQMHQEKNNPFYWNAVGTCYYLEDFPQKALFYFNLANESLKKYNGIDRDLAEANIQNNLGLLNLKFQRFNEAFDCFNAASNLAPNLLTPKINLAQVYLEFDQNLRAINVLETIENKSHGDVDVLYSIALAQYKLNEFDKSFYTISKINPTYLNRADIVGLYAMNLMKKNRYEDAKSILEKRNIAQEFESRNRNILESVTEIIKEQAKKKVN
jgi:tetratricopeptide (TPR) repeat protein